MEVLGNWGDHHPTARTLRDQRTPQAIQIEDKIMLCEAYTMFVKIMFISLLQSSESLGVNIQALINP